MSGGEQSYDVVIVGAGHGGAQAAIALRQTGFEGTIALIGDEPDLPYERPPLSKEYLAGERPAERLALRPASFWADRSIELLLGRRVVAVDAAARRVTDAEGNAIGYRHLVWATGGAPRRLSCDGHALAGVHAIRTRADVDRLRAELPHVARAAVIGGGYIGLEAAAALRKAQMPVVLVEAQDRVLARVAGEPLSRFYEARHRAEGVDIRLGEQVSGLLGDDRVTGVRLASGEAIGCELVIVGIGIVPAVAPLLAAGAAGGDGVEVDAQCRTTLPGVFAIGDVARHASRYAAGARVRIESVQNANDQAVLAARTIAGQPAHYDAVPWFWSNQYDLKLQTVGLSAGHDAIVTRGDPATGGFSLVYLRAGRVIALDCVNAVKDYVAGRRLVTEGIAADPARLADATTALKDLATR